MFKIFNNLKNFFLSFLHFKKIINSIKNPSVSKKEGFNAISLPVVNNFLIGILVVLLFLMGNIFFVSQKTVEEMIHSVANIQFQGTAKHAVEAFKSLTVYQEIIAKRDIFSPYMLAKKKVVIKAQPPPPQPKVQPQQQLAELAQNLKLVGIS
ncbi:hypothetical protein MNBD_UNCLBAC01-101 [hydrothermal vent metagenome]|uniref:Uncharacterized protein n=1 Tax=hydrothermal vent metagenome TaxID=652676 RepID=A0A3B1DB18_9ZZZZ